MSNDISTGTPSAAPPGSSAPAGSSAPPAASESSTTSNADWAKLAEPDRIDAFAEQWNEEKGHSSDSDSDSEPDSSNSEPDSSDEQRRRPNRHERERRQRARLQAALDQKNAEAAAPLQEGEPDDVREWLDHERAAAEAGEQNGADAQAERPETDDEFLDRKVEESQQNLARRDKLNRFQWRQEVAAAHFPGLRETIEQAPPVPLSPAMENEILESNAGPLIHFALARAATAQARGIALPPEDAAILEALPHATERQAAWLIAKLEAQYEAAARQQRAPPAQSQRRLVTNARPPIKPLKGGAGASPSLEELAGTGDKLSPRFVERFNQKMNGRR